MSILGDHVINMTSAVMCRVSSALILDKDILVGINAAAVLSPFLCKSNLRKNFPPQLLKFKVFRFNLLAFVEQKLQKIQRTFISHLQNCKNVVDIFLLFD